VDIVHLRILLVHFIFHSYTERAATQLYGMGSYAAIRKRQLRSYAERAAIRSYAERVAMQLCGKGSYTQLCGKGSCSLVCMPATEKT